jgi:hypothetical protein
MRCRFRLALAFVLSLAFGPFLVGRAEACPNCKEAVAAQPHEAAAMARGYNWSVLFMVAMPFTLLGTGSFMVVRAARRGLLPDL